MGFNIRDISCRSSQTRALPGEDVRALELVCITCAGFKRIEPEKDVGVDLARSGDVGVAGRDEMK